MLYSVTGIAKTPYVLFPNSKICKEICYMGEFCGGV